MSDEVLIKAENVGKKFCRSLKKSLIYGVQDVGYDLLGKDRSHAGLRKAEFWANEGISFELNRGECLGLIGHNGAGKTTLLKMLNGLIKPDIGTIEMHGRVGALIALGAGFNPILTGRENIYINGSVLGFSREEIDEKMESIIAFSEIGDFIDSPVQNYSSGMQVRLGFSVASQMEPDILLIDEVLAVGDLGFRVKCLNRIHELLETSAVIFVSHSMPFVARICNQAMLLQHGKILQHSDIVSDVIDHYHAEFETGEQSVMGSGEVKVLSVTQLGRKSEGPVDVEYGESLQLEIKLSVDSTAHNIGIRLVVWNADQRPVMDFVNEDHQSFIWGNDATEVSLTMKTPPMSLTGGKHAITIAIFDPDTTRVLCRMDNAFRFLMGTHISTGAESFLPVHWEIQRGMETKA